MADEDATQVIKERVTQVLDSRGVLARLKAELRANVFLAINDQDIQQGGVGLSDKSDALRRQQLLADPMGRVAVGLVRELLDWCDCRFTVKVLAPEMQLPERCDDSGHDSEAAVIAGRTCLAQTLDLDEMADSGPLLLQLLRGHASTMRTVVPPASSARAKLAAELSPASPTADSDDDDGGLIGTTVLVGGAGSSVMPGNDRISSSTCGGGGGGGGGSSSSSGRPSEAGMPQQQGVEADTAAAAAAVKYADPDDNGRVEDEHDQEHYEPTALAQFVYGSPSAAVAARSSSSTSHGGTLLDSSDVDNADNNGIDSSNDIDIDDKASGEADDVISHGDGPMTMSEGVVPLGGAPLPAPTHPAAEAAAALAPAVLEVTAPAAAAARPVGRLAPLLPPIRPPAPGGAAGGGVRPGAPPTAEMLRSELLSQGLLTDADRDLPAPGGTRGANLSGWHDNSSRAGELSSSRGSSTAASEGTEPLEPAAAAAAATAAAARSMMAWAGGGQEEQAEGQQEEEKGDVQKDPLQEEEEEEEEEPEIPEEDFSLELEGLDDEEDLPAWPHEQQGLPGGTLPWAAAFGTTQDDVGSDNGSSTSIQNQTDRLPPLPVNFSINEDDF